MVEVVDERKATKEDGAGKKKSIVEGKTSEVMKVLSGDQRSLTCVKEDFPTVSGNSEEGRASYMHNCFKATYSLRQFPP